MSDADEASDRGRFHTSAERPGTEPGWPIAAYSEHTWPGDLYDIPSRYRDDYRGAYRAAILPTIATRTAHLPSATRSLLDEASAEAARFDAELGSDFAPLESILLRSESAASSQIERLTASAKAIALAELGDTDRRNAVLITANSRAMIAAINLATRLDENAIVEMHHALMSRTDTRAAGRLRQEQVWIGTSSYGPHTAAFVPPHHSNVPAALSDLVAYIGRADISVLEHVAIAHAQFESIHPFTDGNGRTGRALVQAMLRAKGLTRSVTVPVSGGLLADQAGYLAALAAYQDGDVVPIVERFAEATHFATRQGRKLAAQLADIKAQWTNTLKARPQAVVWKAIDPVIRQPVLDAAFLQRELTVSDTAATDALARLVGIGALRQLGTGKRNRRYEAPEVLAALEAFADSARRQPPTS